MNELRAADLESLRARQSAKWRTHPPEVLPLTVAEMDFPLAPQVRSVLAEAVARSDTGYAAPDEALGASLAAFALRRWGWQIHPELTETATDVGVACVDVLRSLGVTGENVVISPPVYPPFFSWLQEVGARLVPVPLTQVQGTWHLDLDALEQAFKDRPKAYVLCNPHNPVGRVHSKSELTALVQLASEWDVFLIADEIHAPITFSGAPFTPLLSLPGASEIAVSLISASKAWNLAGLKCASIVTASERASALLRRRPEDSQDRIGHLGVLASVAAYTRGVGWLDDLVHTLEMRRDLVAHLLASSLPMLRWTEPEATFLAWLDCAELALDDPAGHFLREAGVALEHGRQFGEQGEGWVRMNFATSEEILRDAVHRMAASLR